MYVRERACTRRPVSTCGYSFLQVSKFILPARIKYIFVPLGCYSACTSSSLSTCCTSPLQVIGSSPANGEAAMPPETTHESTSITDTLPPIISPCCSHTWRLMCLLQLINKYTSSSCTVHRVYAYLTSCRQRATSDNYLRSNPQITCGTAHALARRNDADETRGTVQLVQASLSFI